MIEKCFYLTIRINIRLEVYFLKNKSSLTTLSPGCFTKQFNSAVWPTMAVTFRGPISSKSGLFKSLVGLLPATTLARLDPPENNMKDTIKETVHFMNFSIFRKRRRTL